MRNPLDEPVTDDLRSNTVAFRFVLRGTHQETFASFPPTGIAHRLSTIRHADRIIVLDRGRIVEEGSHNALMSQGGHYALLYNTYFRHQSPDYKPGEGFVPVLVPLVNEATTFQSP